MIKKNIYVVGIDLIVNFFGISLGIFPPEYLVFAFFVTLINTHLRSEISIFHFTMHYLLNFTHPNKTIKIITLNKNLNYDGF